MPCSALALRKTRGRPIPTRSSSIRSRSEGAERDKLERKGCLTSGVVHRRARDGVRSVWLTDRTRPFVIVLVEGAGQPDPPLGPFGHLGVACKSREEIDRLYAEACREGRPTRAPTDVGEPVGYVARIADPDGNSLELSFGQEVGLAVEGATKG